MGYFDQYDPRVCFDDLPGQFDEGYYGSGYASHWRPHPIETAFAIIGRSRRRRRAPSSVIGFAPDRTRRSFAVRSRVIGDAEAATPFEGATFTKPPIGPMYNALYDNFAQRLPTPKLARVDDVQSYADFRAARRDPYLAQLEQRLNALVAAFDAHVADSHGGGRVEALEEALQQHLQQCVCGGDQIFLPILECMTGQIECWQDGPEILCTLRVVGPDGQVRMVTSGESVARAADEVVGCAIAEDVDPDDLLVVAPSVIQMIGAAKLVEEIAPIARNVIVTCQGEAGAVVALVPAADPTLAAAMMLLQRCQQRDRRAYREAQRLKQEYPDLWEEAASRLYFAQKGAKA